jgi:23S rRNA U2552 (ribose-2'-O)-methylase RlmE/FtsJ
LAEGPGGFIEAVVKMRNNANDRYYGMTLINDHDHNVPGWHKSKHFLDQNKNVIIEYGKDGTGDLQNGENLLYCYEKYANSMDLITADGGFDFSYDFNNQETECTKLIFCQICFAIAMQKIGGTFVIKFFDSFTRISLEMLYLLSALYEEVYFIKPNTSRHANSEKYVVCKKYRANADLQGFIMKLYMIIQAMQEQEQEQQQEQQQEQEKEKEEKEEKNIISLFAVEIPYLYSNRIEEYNAIFGQQQIENIHMTLQLILNNKRDKLETMKKTHIQKCIEWCQKYNIPYHKNILNNNIFLSSLSSKQQQPILI